MAEAEGPTESIINFVPTVCFVPRGVAKAKPDKIRLHEQELALLIKETKKSLKENGETDEDEDDDDDDDDEIEQNNVTSNAGNVHNNDADSTQMDVDDISDVNVRNTTQGNNENHNEDEYAFNSYDNESTGQLANLYTVVDYDCLVPDEENDSEAEDDIIKPTDNLLLVGRVQNNAASMEVWIFNQMEKSLFTFSDYFLPSFPLCIEWLNHDPGSDTVANMCAVGSMDPIITIWDLDIINSLEPAFKLGSKGSRKKQIQPYGHKDAVLDLSWNCEYEHILASGSVDKSLLLWDLDKGYPHTSITVFKDTVQSIEFHPDDAHLILAGCADGYIRLIDCRSTEEDQSCSAKWKINKEVEKVVWNPNDRNLFISGDNTGALYYADKRQNKKFLWSSVNAHDNEISGICFNTKIPNLLTSTSIDGFLKIWNFNSTELKPIYTHDFGMGRLQCMKQCPEDPFTFAFGGEKTPWCRIYNIKNFEAVRRAFNIRDILQD